MQLWNNYREREGYILAIPTYSSESMLYTVNLDKQHDGLAPVLWNLLKFWFPLGKALVENMEFGNLCPLIYLK